jgi:hypothetical protein
MRFAAAAFAAELFSTSISVQAAVIVDQEVDLPSSGFNDLTTTHWQSFQQAGDNIAGAAIRIDSTGSNGNALSGSITLTILDGAPDGGGNVITAATALTGGDGDTGTGRRTLVHGLLRACRRHTGYGPLPSDHQRQRFNFDLQHQQFTVSARRTVSRRHRIE